ncbi:hypothetical protein QBC39DRAFT_384871 [Podospora conica]|nr:hypothetical protein QBC39DRAFT_384871 [Schizothecium conicum]
MRHPPKQLSELKSQSSWNANFSSMVPIWGTSTPVPEIVTPTAPVPDISMSITWTTVIKPATSTMSTTSTAAGLVTPTVTVTFLPTPTPTKSSGRLIKDPTPSTPLFDFSFMRRAGNDMRQLAELWKITIGFFVFLAVAAAGLGVFMFLVIVLDKVKRRHGRRSNTHYCGI